MSPLAWTHAIRDIPAAGLEIEQRASTAECEAVARELGILTCSRLEATYRLKSKGGGRIGVEGTIKADVTQACVVTLEPVHDRISETFAAEFADAHDDEAASPLEIEVRSGDMTRLEGPDLERIEDGRVDVGRLVIEELATLLDPYPRSPGASLDWKDPLSETTPASPFAALAELKRGDKAD